MTIELVVIHAMNFPVVEGDAAAALENLAPVHPSRTAQAGHDLLAVRDLVRRLGSPAAGCCWTSATRTWSRPCAA